ncbi:helix-turn-helix domain-containing protein [Streptomyces roseochromogenus]|uniref:MmyB family transcriptional regulator n=1 Tax=Streptomyces roseochromogenus TaxID=285450 RepID=UPI00131A034B|nr:helix-turn-helix domain-containing protein [Streptomyces roseochromogenus]
MLRAWRKARDRKAVPGLTARYGARRRKGLTQAEVAFLAGVSEGWYSRLERGVPDGYSDEFLDSLVRILGLDEAQRTHLFLEVTGREPALRCRPDASTIDPVVSQIVHCLPWPAYTYDARWDIRVFNEAAARDFPWMIHGVNVMIWALTYPEARFQLIDWEETWAKPMASQLRIAWRAHPHDPRLAEVVQHIKDADPVAGRILEHDVTAVTHPDGDRRRLYLPHQDEEVAVEFVAFGRLGNTIRLMVVMPADIAQHAKDAMPSTIASVLDGTLENPASA